MLSRKLAVHAHRAMCLMPVLTVKGGRRHHIMDNKARQSICNRYFSDSSTSVGQVPDVDRFGEWIADRQVQRKPPRAEGNWHWEFNLPPEDTFIKTGFKTSTCQSYRDDGMCIKGPTCNDLHFSSLDLSQAENIMLLGTDIQKIAALYELPYAYWSYLGYPQIRNVVSACHKLHHKVGIQVLRNHKKHLFGKVSSYDQKRYRELNEMAISTLIECQDMVEVEDIYEKNPSFAATGIGLANVVKMYTEGQFIVIPSDKSSAKRPDKRLFPSFENLALDFLRNIRATTVNSSGLVKAHQYMLRHYTTNMMVNDNNIQIIVELMSEKALPQEGHVHEPVVHDDIMSHKLAYRYLRKHGQSQEAMVDKLVPFIDLKKAKSKK